MASKDVRFSVPEARLDGPYGTPDAFEWEMYDDDGELVDGPKSSTDVSSRPLPNGRIEFLVRCFIDDSGLPPGEYALEISHNEVFLHSGTHLVEEEEEYASDDYYALEGDGGVVVDVHPDLGGNARWSLYDGNALLGQGSGVPGSGLPLDLSLYGVKTGLSPVLLLLESSAGYTQHSIWQVTPEILRAMGDLRKYVDRLNRDMRLDGLRFGDSDYLHWLEMGRDKFNAAVLTDFDMTEATGPIRSLWLSCSQHEALRTRYLEEGLTGFSYNGAAVTLDVDTASALDSQASNLESQIQDTAQRLKINLAQKGLVSGPGKWSMNSKSIGATGRSLSPVSPASYPLLGGGRLGLHRGFGNNRRRG